MKIEVKGLDELRARLADREKFNALMGAAMQASLLVLWEQAGREYYPPEPDGSEYTRTGTLGRTLGVSMGGGTSGRPEIYETRPNGSGYQGAFGTRLEYAPYVIGEEQAGVHQGRWLKLSEVAELALDKITEVWQRMANEIAAYLEGRGQ